MQQLLVNNFLCNRTITEIDRLVYPKLLGDQSDKLKAYRKLANQIMLHLI